jgi:hypothetical protein
MKRIYLSLFLVLVATTLFAQRKTDLVLTHYYCEGSGTPALMKTGDKVLSSAGGEKTYTFAWVFKVILNASGTANDTIRKTDYIALKKYYSGTATMIGFNGATSPNGLGIGDSASYGQSGVSLSPTASVTQSGTSTVNWCDSAWTVDSANGGVIVTDLNVANNKPCTSIELTSWVTGVHPALLNSTPKGIVLYPNPATYKLNLLYHFDNTTDASIDIFDMTGKLVSHQELGKDLSGTMGFNVDLSNVSHGAYLIKLNTNTGSVNQRFNID